MKRGKSYTIVDFYQYYLDEVKSNINYKVDYKTYRKILEEYFKYIRDEIIERGEEVKLPSRIGVIRIIKTKPTYWDCIHCYIDFQKTREFGKTILY